MKKQKTSSPALKPNALVIGNFGKKTKQIDGQTVKTQVFYDSLHRYSDYQKIGLCDTSYGLFSTGRTIINSFVGTDDVFFLAGRRALTSLGPLLIVLRQMPFIRLRAVHYIVVGGWLPDLVATNRYFRLLSSRFDSLFVEIPSMQERLQAINRNAFVLPNFRDVDSFSSDIPRYNGTSKSNQKTIRLLFFSRMMEKKGVDIAIDTVDRLVRKDIDCILHLYGPFNDVEYQARISKRIAARQYVSYQGVIDPKEDIYGRLGSYDFMLFPSHYTGEGFPGAIVDAFIAGVPVAASIWKYNPEIIRPGFDGELFPVEDFAELCSRFLATLSDDLPKLEYYRSHARARRGDFAARTCIRSLLESTNRLYRGTKRSFSRA